MSNSNSRKFEIGKIDNIVDAIDNCLVAASLAPSTHNTQPWRIDSVEISNGIGDVKIIITDELKATDPDKKNANLSMGAFIENFDQCAGAQGWEASVSIQNPNLLNIRVRKSAVDKSSLAPFITKRYSEKRIFESDRISTSAINEIMQNENIELLTTDTDEINELAQIYVRSAKLKSTDRYFAKELSSWLRISTRSNDGMNFLSSGESRIKFAVGKSLLMFTPNILNKMADRYYKLINVSSAVGYISMNSSKQNDVILAGRIMERAALIAAKYNLSLTPLAAITDDSSGRQLLMKHSQSKKQPAIFFRVSDIKLPVQHTGRRNISAGLG